LPCHDRESASLFWHAALNWQDICGAHAGTGGENARATRVKGTIPDHAELKTGIHGVPMTDASDGASGLDRRGFIQLAAAAAGLAGGRGAAPAQPSETLGDITRQPSPSFADELNTADINVETLIASDAFLAFGENLPPNCNARSCR
jgi:hypothetical protein